MRETKGVIFVALLLISIFPTILRVEAINGEANVYIIELSGVPGWWVNNTSRVKDGAVDACTLQGSNIQFNLPRAHPKRNVDYPPYYEAKPYVVTTWSEYKYIIESYSGIVVVNTHGEYLPVPNGYNREGWIDKIAEAMLRRRLTWVHSGGYTFYRVWYEQTGDAGEWTEYVNGICIGAGFRRLMNYINLKDVDLWAPSGKDNARTTFNSECQIAQRWTYVTWQFEATVGRPLKFDEFKEYLITPLFLWTDSSTNKSYFPGAVVSFAKAGERYTSNGGGAYVHMGVGGFFNVTNYPLDADYGRGFIGTAAALWAECMGFNAKLDAKSGGSIWGPYSENASLIVYPSISGVQMIGTDLKVTMIFAVYGVTQSYYEDVFDFDWVRFFIDEVPGSTWSGVTMRVDLGYSREGYGDGLLLSGLYDENHAPLGLLPAGIMWLLGTPGLLAGHPVAAAILWGIGGFKLLAQWMQQGYTENYTGLGKFAPYINFKYKPVENFTTSAGRAYYEFMTLTTVELKIPTSGKSGWLKLPLSYNITALPNWYSGWGEPTPGLLIAADTLQLAIWFDGAGQNDAGTGGDASNSQSSPTPLMFGYYYGYLGGGDNIDWYSFQVTSTTLPFVLIEMTPPSFVNFDLEVYTPNGVKYGSYNGAGTTESLQLGTQIGLWKMRIYIVSGSGVYSLHLSMKGEREACPFVYVWNGQQFIIGNNILPTSLKSNGTNVEDYYKLEQILIPKYKGTLFSLYSLQICEFENEHSYINQVKLLAVNHSPDCKIAVTPNGEIVTYHQPSPPLSCIDNNGIDRLNEISLIDGDLSNPSTYFDGYRGYYLILDFGRIDAENAKLILRSDRKCGNIDLGCCIEVQILNNSQWQTVSVIAPREYWATEAVNLTPYITADQELTVRLYWTMPHRLDYVGLDMSPSDQIKVISVPPTRATHSTQGDITTNLIFNDEIYAELFPGEQINLTFILPNSPPKATRTFIFYTNGYYHTITK